MDIILDTDLGSDCDDAMALAYLIYASKRLGIDIKAITHSNGCKEGPSVIASVLRHKNYATTAKHYIDISTDKALEAVGKIDRKPKVSVEQ
jgi:hypothetical protein